MGRPDAYDFIVVVVCFAVPYSTSFADRIGPESGVTSPESVLKLIAYGIIWPN
jgi:hypothetical protein